MKRLLLALLLALPAADAFAYRAAAQGRKVVAKEVGAHLPMDAVMVQRSNLNPFANGIIQDILNAKDRRNLVSKTPEGMVLHVESAELNLVASFQGGRLVGTKPSLWERVKEAAGSESGRIKLGFDDIPRGPRYLSTETRLEKLRYWVSEKTRGYRMVRVDKLYPHPEDTFWSSGPSTQALREHRAYIQANGQINIADQGPIQVVVRDDGYAILNGRHRWQEATKSGIYYVPVEVK